MLILNFINYRLTDLNCVFNSKPENTVLFDATSVESMKSVNSEVCMAISPCYIIIWKFVLMLALARSSKL